MAMTVTKMTSERTQAYGRVIRTLEDLGPAKLLPAEQESVREAADALFFCESGTDPIAGEALHRIRTVVDHLVASERWTEERASELVRDLEACGPASLVA
jgi:hypothetical protein